ncbi:DEAD/DEAH box helicase [Patescibacteria group bacterium]|nr:DEAD/DEAH box helicase [Patescibacteria group bacterium]
MEELKSILIVSFTPYFLDKGFLWFIENEKEILAAQRSQSFFQDNTVFLEKDLDRSLSEVLRKLDEMGYEKVIDISQPGEFSQKGGLLSIFPVNTAEAVRIDFLGNRIETIERLDIKVEDEQKSRELMKKHLNSQKLFSDLKDLKGGEYLVHLDHGIGRYSGEQNNYYVLEYAKNDKLYVPFGLERKLSRYVSFTEPEISRLGSSLWQKTKRKIKEETEKMAKELLDIYAQRESSERKPYFQNDEIDELVASTFKHAETPDQEQTIREVIKDLEKPKPMDRLVCGDVGFGKTEVALRAAVKVAKSGYQAVLIAPTTILANQHFKSFKERLKDIPLNVEILSRLQTKKQQKEIIKKIDKIDILIGTHRILSEDVSPLLFQKDGQGLLIIDDEQRFGVKQKERLKSLRSKIDILSLSATPIPRTLYLSLSALREISLMQTPPKGRLPVKTFVLARTKKTVQKAIAEEIERGGQTYYLHNRIDTITMVKKTIMEMFPDLKVGTAHGKMDETELIKTMEDFQNKEFELLIATTIIENGIDIESANTLIVADSAKLGLSQAYQLRGRVGRSHRQAFAYFLYNKKVKGKAAERLKALKEAQELGSGYKIALKDMEIRGAGNILGKQQSGSVNKVGLNLYCQMLADAVGKIKEASFR